MTVAQVKHQQLEKQKYVNVRSLAIQKNPTLFKRGRGKLHLERDVGPSRMAAVTHTGNEAELKAYIERNRAELEAEAASLREQARQAVSAAPKCTL